MKSIIPNPDIEMRLIVQVTDVHRKREKNVFTSLVLSIFSRFLGSSRTCASIVFSISGFGIIKNTLFGLLFLFNNVQAQDTDYPMFGITAGKVGAFTPDRRSDRYGLEYRAKPFSKWKIIPAFGIAWSTEESKFIYSELKHDWKLKHNFIFTGSLGVGLFDNNDNLDLGHPIEFRTGFELSYRFKNHYRLGIAAFHLSNSRLSQKNPGTEAIALSILIPLHSK